MRSCLIVLALLAGCASKAPVSTQPASLNELKQIKLSSRDCAHIDYHVNYAERQLKLKGLLDKNPEDLSDEDRQYNATARIMVWSLRIGCANPNRYAKK